MSCDYGMTYKDFALQWGRPCEGTEIPFRRFLMIPMMLLQWGRPCEGTEICRPRRWLVLFSKLQWGRPCEGTEIPRARSRYPRMTEASMGPSL